MGPPPPERKVVLETAHTFSFSFNAAPWFLVSVGSVFVLFVAFLQPLDDALWLLRGINLGFHETGHLVFGLLGWDFLTALGGTLLQLLLPGATVWHFYRRGQVRSAWAAVFWIGQNLLGVGTYMADARRQELELVGGGVHDWTAMFESLGVLIYDQPIGRATRILGAFLMAWGGVSALWPPEGQAPDKEESPAR